MTMLFGYPFNIDFKLEEGSREYFFHKVTQPLLKTIQDLHSSQSKLINLLKKKDSEIEEYKCEGKEIAQRYLRTIMFDEKEHVKNHTQFHDTFGVSGVSNNLLDKVLTIPEKKIGIKQDPEVSISVKTDPEIKMEPELTVKSEPESINSQTLITTVATATDIKQEIKTECNYTPKKKKKKLNF